jgi:transcription initiation factor TFIID subunit 15
MVYRSLVVLVMALVSPLRPCKASYLIDNGVVMGDIPSSQNMISTIIINPGPGDTIAANQDFTVSIQVANLVAGSFTNPDSTYYAAPQALSGGNIVGHTHITIQSLGNNIATTTPPDAGTFAFFKGINDAGNGNGGLSAAVTGGLPAGVYRVCTMTSASNHQPVTMPVNRQSINRYLLLTVVSQLAQRGAQDDCNKFTVTDGGANTSANTSASTSASTSTSTSASAGANTGINTGVNTGVNTGNGTANSNNNSSSAASGNQNGRGRNNRGGAKGFVLREFVA